MYARGAVILLLFCVAILPVMVGHSNGTNVSYVGSSESFSVTVKKVIPVNGNESGLSLVPAKVANWDCWLLLDTGASHLFLSNEFSRKHSLVGKPSKIARGSNIDVDQLPEVKASLEVGMIRLSEHSFTEISLEDFTEVFAVQVDNILGADFLNRYIYSIDLKHNTLSILKEDDVTIDSDEMIPMVIRNNCVYFDLDIHGNTLGILLDTGRDIPEVAQECLKNYEGEFTERQTEKINVSGRRKRAVKRV